MRVDDFGFAQSPILASASLSHRFWLWLRSVTDFGFGFAQPTFTERSRSEPSKQVKSIKIYQSIAKKIIEINKSAIKIVTEDKTTALVVETPTPLAPPLVL